MKDGGVRKAEQQVIRFGVFELNVRSGELRKSGVRVRLQGQPVQLLHALLERPGELVTHEELRRRIWPDTVVDYETGLAGAVSKVRRALGDDPDNPRFIETIPRRGYRFLAAMAPDGTRPVQSIAVLPFENLSGDSDQEYFSDGLTDAVITELAGIRALKVISRTSVMQFKGIHRPLPAIAAELGVDAILEGSVQRERDRVRVTAQLIEAATDTHLWADRFDRSLRSILALQSEVAGRVAQEIHARLTPEEAERLRAPATVDTDAYETYLRGKAHAMRSTPEALQNALKYYQAALEIDPESTLAHAGVAEVLLMSIVLALMEPAEAGPRALASARRAVELAPNLSQGFVVLAGLQQMYEWDWDAAEASFRRALEASPNNAEAHVHFALMLTCLGRFDEAEQLMRQGLELDPLNLFFQHLRGVQCTWMGAYEEAVAGLAKVVARAPFMQMAHLTMWASFHALGRLDESFHAARTGYEAVRDEVMVEALDSGFAEAGFEGAMKRAADLLEARSRTIYVQPHITSLFYDFAGETEKVFACIEQGYRRREHAMSYINRKPFSARVRNDPRYAEILDRMRLPR